MERNRIMRDLHDDVGARILTLIHKLNGADQEVAQSALRSLKDTIYTLDHSNTSYLSDVVDSWEGEARIRTKSKNMHLKWFSEDFGELTLNPRYIYNLTRIVREAITNALKYSGGDYLSMVVTLREKDLDIEISDKSKGCLPEDWREGRGLSHMKTRINEICGSICWDLKECARNMGDGSDGEVPVGNDGRFVGSHTKETVVQISVPLHTLPMQ